MGRSHLLVSSEPTAELDARSCFHAQGGIACRLAWGCTVQLRAVCSFPVQSTTPNAALQRAMLFRKCWPVGFGSKVLYMPELFLLLSIVRAHFKLRGRKNSLERMNTTSTVHSPHKHWMSFINFGLQKYTVIQLSVEYELIMRVFCLGGMPRVK